jgi:lipoprotein-anchoring transpeptidase ErfK/SrfK
LAAAVLFLLAQDNKKDRRTNMRRLVVISSRKPKFIAASVGAVLSLTSIHLAATARIAKTAFSTQQSAVSNQASALSQISNSTSIAKDEKNTPSIAKPSASAISSTSPAHQRQIVISIADRKLALMEDGQVLKTYPIAVGTRRTPSPDGDFVIVNHAKDPVYRHGDKEVPPGNDNPLGSRWMGLSLKGYGIHGTNVQSSVGKAASHGCFRMRKQDVEELYTLVQVGDTVTVRRERDAMIAQVFAAPTSTQAAVTLAAATSTSEIQSAAAATRTTIETTQQ